MIHHDLGTVGKNVVHLRNGVAVLARVREDPRFVLDHPPALGAPQHPARPELVDVAVAARGDEWTGLGGHQTIRPQTMREVLLPQ